MNEFVYYSDLYNIYGFLLTKNQQEIFSLYYEDDLSFSEIAEFKKVSKSYIGKIILQTKKKLDYYEANLHHYELLKKIEEKRS
jgi:predicted DNA-binding protein YlxM (UPF0122 family)